MTRRRYAIILLCVAIACLVLLGCQWDMDRSEWADGEDGKATRDALWMEVGDE